MEPFAFTPETEAETRPGLLTETLTDTDVPPELPVEVEKDVPYE